MEEKKSNEVIDLRLLFKILKEKRKLFYKILPAVFIISSLLIVSVPRYYICDVMLAPETDNISSGGSLSSIASSFGFDIGGAMSSDAISPTLYPDLIASKDFVITLFPVEVKTSDGEVKTTLYEYYEKYQKHAWWSYPRMWLGEMMNKIIKPEEAPIITDEGEDGKKVSPVFFLTKKQDDIAKAIIANITCSVDKKTDVISISIQDQDKLVCATIADSVRARLQDFITNYRTNKARVDMEYYEQLTKKAKEEYDSVRHLYTRSADTNMDLILTTAKARIEDLENDMQLRYNTYNVMNTQLQAAKAKVQERTPAFTIIQGASVPLKPAGPKRMLFVLGMLLLASMGIVFYCIKDEIFK